ncbi:hypothetical protein DSO57_1026687 [Entomophthora muscae]|uniref:Uncharacterized protein n=1 Tax=Entomophthora muscae TaxID=34485 RepID=A0ACC2T272_9FUNG|nr:hypothetical protein DSO57_1026687 [Entomophthora muscae]
MGDNNKRTAIDPEKLAQLLDQLAPETTDEEKFASLLVLSRTVDPKDKVQMDQLFARLNFRFLDRLLKQGIKKIKMSEKEGEVLPKDSMVAIAVNILAPFFYQEQRCGSDVLLARLPLLAANLNCKEEGVACAILRCCLISSTASRGAQAIATAKIPSTNRSILQHILDEFQKERLASKAEESEFLTLSLQIFEKVGVTLLRSSISEPSKLSECLIEFLVHFIQNIHDSIDKLQFKLVEILVVWYDAPTVQSIIPGELVPKDAWMKLHAGLQKLLQAPSRSAPRAKALQLCSLLTRHYGFGWLVIQSGSFPSLLLRLAATEIRVGLEEVDLSTNGDMDLLMSGLELLTHTTQFLASQPEEPGVTTFTIPSLDQVGLADANMAQVLLWLRETNKDCLYFLADQKKEENPLLLVVLQSVCIYLAEDPGLFEEADSRPLPLIPLFGFLAWCFSRAGSIESVDSLGLVSPHGARAILQACECGGESADAVLDFASDFVAGLMKHISHILGQAYFTVTYASVTPFLPEILPSLRAIASIVELSQKDVFPDPKSKTVFSTIYKAAQAILGEDGLL